MLSVAQIVRRHAEAWDRSQNECDARGIVPLADDERAAIRDLAKFLSRFGHPGEALGTIRVCPDSAIEASSEDQTRLREFLTATGSTDGELERTRSNAWAHIVCKRAAFFVKSVQPKYESELTRRLRFCYPGGGY